MRGKSLKKRKNILRNFALDLKNIMLKIVATAIALTVACHSAYAQQSNDALFEACNAVEDAPKRLECFRQATEKRSPTPAGPAYSALKDSLIALDGQLNQGISLVNYNQALLAPARELALFETKNPNANPQALGALRAAMQSYNDASRFWSASISAAARNRGTFTASIMTYEDMILHGVSDLVGKYSFPTRSVGLFGALKGVSRFDGLTTIWAAAQKAHEEAWRALDDKPAASATQGLPSPGSDAKASATNACPQDVVDRLRAGGMPETDIKRTCGSPS